MELVVLSDTKDTLTFELKGEGHTFCNGLKKELYADSAVKEATYTIRHPLVGIPEFLVHTDGKKAPRAALKDAVKRLHERNKDFLKSFKSLK
jgi:DNA-directed RNA polymerase subunit L